MDSSRTALKAAALSLAGLILTGILALALPAARGFDATTMDGFMALDRPIVNPLMLLIIQVGNPVVYAFLGALIVGLALRRERPRLAIAIVVILIGSVASADALKLLLAGLRPGTWVSPDWSIGGDSWPSGHATAAMSLSMCAIMASPPARRHLVAAAGAALTIAVSYASVITGGHLPSDVVGAFFLSGLWTTLAIAVLRCDQVEVAPTIWRSFWKRSVSAYAVIWGGAVTLVLGVVIARPVMMAGYVSDHIRFLAGALAIAVLVQVLVAAFSRLLSAGPAERRHA